MEETIIRPQQDTEAARKDDKFYGSFIVANTTGITVKDLHQKCIIPVYSKDNESTISHSEFISAMMDVISDLFPNESIQEPKIRVSHPVKGRVPGAMGKPARDLLEEEKTLYFERMAFLAELPGIRETVNGNELSLSIGGVRAYNLENLYNRKSEEKFKLFVGFQNRVCTNLCVSTDGFKSEVKVRTTAELARAAYDLITNYSSYGDLGCWNRMSSLSITENQFAQLIGKAKMFNYMPARQKKDLLAFPLADSQISAITRDYYSDESFCRTSSG